MHSFEIHFGKDFCLSVKAEGLFIKIKLLKSKDKMQVDMCQNRASLLRVLHRQSYLVLSYITMFEWQRALSWDVNNDPRSEDIRIESLSQNMSQKLISCLKNQKSLSWNILHVCINDVPKLLEIPYLILDVLIEVKEVHKIFQKDMEPWAQHSSCRAITLLSSKLVF